MKVVGRLLLALTCLWAARLAVLGVLLAAQVGHVQRHHLESGFVILLALGTVTVALFRRGPGVTAGQPTLTSDGKGAQTIVADLVFVGSACVLLWPALRVGLLSDDFYLLDRVLQSDLGLWRSGWHARPAPLLVWALLAGLVPEPSFLMHLVNLLLHGLNAALVARLARSLGLASEPALLAGALFLAGPAAIEPVVWCSGLQDVLMTTAALSFVLAWRSDARFARRATLACASLGLALASKEAAVALPLLALVLWRERPKGRREAGLLALAVGLTAAFAVWRLSVQPIPDSYASPPTWYTLQCLLLRPFAALGSPWSASLLSRAPWLTALSASGLAVLLVLGFWRWRNDRAGFARGVRLAAWVLVAAAPLYRYFFIAPDLQNSRYIYLGAAGWMILVADLLAGATSALPRPRVAFLCAASLGLIVAIAAQQVHLEPWERAARKRDDILAQAIAAAADMRPPKCATLAFQNLPDNVEGAYVFRNGFVPALRARAPEVAARIVPIGQANCPVMLGDGGTPAARL